MSSEEKIDASYFSAWPDESPDARYNSLIEAYRTAFFGKLPNYIVSEIS